MKFGFFLMPCHAPSENPTLAFDRDLELIEYAESLGFDEVWIGEHHTAGWETIVAPDIFIAAAAQRTSRIRLGTGVVSLPYHHPFEVAERIAFLDHLTHGRLDFGVGPGLLTTDVEMFGVDPGEVRPMMDESLEIILKLFTEPGPVNYEGTYWTIKDMELMVKPYQLPHPPMAVATMGGEHGTGLAAKHGFKLLAADFFNGLKSEKLAQQWAMLEAMAKPYGRAPRREDWRAAAYVYLAEDEDKALDLIADRATKEQREYFIPLRRRRSDPPLDLDSPLDVRETARNSGWLVTTPDKCVEWLREMDEGSGGLGGLLLIATEWSDWEAWKHSLELFARFVMPEFRGHTAGPTASWQRLLSSRGA